MFSLSFTHFTVNIIALGFSYYDSNKARAGKNLVFKKKYVFRFLSFFRFYRFLKIFLGFNVGRLETKITTEKYMKNIPYTVTAI